MILDPYEAPRVRRRPCATHGGCGPSGGSKAEPIRIFDGPGVDHACAQLRKAGLEVEIIHPPKVLQGGEIDGIQVSPRLAAAWLAEFDGA